MRVLSMLIGPIVVAACAGEGAGAHGTKVDARDVSERRVAEAASVTLRPGGDGDSWTFNYSVDQPTAELRLYRPSDGSRAASWRLFDADFELIARPYEDGEEDVIRRRDGARFKAVSVSESTAHNADVIGYWPFARLGAGGGVFGYTGRILACAEECPADATGGDGPFPVTIDPGDAAHFLVGSAVQDGPYSYLDRNDGLKFYAGATAPVETNDFVAVIDPALPGDIKRQLDTLFPPLMAYFTERLGAIDEKPSMFVSYNVPGVREGSHIKGGTLPGQVFMHFEGARATEIAARPTFPYFLAWFFAHEAAHLFQNYRGVDFPANESWMHEGGADFLAFLALKDLDAAPEDYLNDRLRSAFDRCAEELQRGPLRGAMERGNFQAYYDCGLLLHMAAAAEVAGEDGSNPFELWRAYVRNAKENGEWSTARFAGFVEELGADVAARLARDVMDAKIEDPTERLLADLPAAGVDTDWASANQ